MYKILLCCASGITTNMLVNSIKKEANEQNIKVMCWAVAETAVELSFADADCILVAPQCQSSFGKIEKLSAESSIPAAIIDGVDFSKMNGKAVLEQAIQLIDKK